MARDSYREGGRGECRPDPGRIAREVKMGAKRNEIIPKVK